MKSFLEEFKAFAVRGNVVDLAVAVIIGTAFGKIVSSLVDTVIMPIVGVFLGGVDFTGWAFTFGHSVIAYGKFIQSIIDFLIIALVIFIAVRMLSRMKKTEEIVAEVPAVPSEEVLLLREIRDAVRR